MSDILNRRRMLLKRHVTIKKNKSFARICAGFAGEPRWLAIATTVGDRHIDKVNEEITEIEVVITYEKPC